MYDVLVQGRSTEDKLKIDAVLGDPDAQAELDEARLEAVREAGGEFA